MAPTPAALLNSVFSMLTLISSLLITAYHLYTTHKNTSSLCTNRFLRSNPSILLSYFLLFISIISGISLLLDSAVTGDLCPYSQYYGPTLYSIFKTTVYLILGCRIYMSLRTSIYRHSAKTLIIWSVILIVWTLFNVIAGNVTVTAQVEETQSVTKCIVIPSYMYAISQSLLDIVSAIFNSIIFVRPVFNSLQLSPRNDNIKPKAIACKQCILTIIAVFSSIIAIIGIEIFHDIVPVFVGFDIIVSTLSVILMFEWNSFITSKIFVCCMPTFDSLVTREQEDNIHKTDVTTSKKTIEINSTQN
eukprot:242930_1